MANVGTVLINIKARSTQMVKGLRKARARIRTFRRSLNKTFGGMAKMATIAGAAIMGGVVIAMRSVIKVFSDFESKMAETRAVLRGLSQNAFAPLVKLARELGQTTVFTATESAEAMTLLARAGFSVNEIMKATVAVMDLAAASGATLAEMANILATAIRGFGLAADQAGRVADVLALASARANTTVTDLGVAFSYVAPIARSLGLTIEQTAALLGTLSDAGLQADKAGTGLRAVLAQLAEEMGPGGLDPILDKFVEQGLSAAEAFAQFGRRGAPAILALVNMRASTRSLTDELETAANASREMAEVRLDTVHGSFMLVKSAAQEMMLVIGDALAPVIRDVAEAMRVVFVAAANTFGSMLKGSERSIDRVRTLTDTIATIVDAFAIVLDVVSKIVNVFEFAIEGIRFSWNTLFLGMVSIATYALSIIGGVMAELGMVSAIQLDGMLSGLKEVAIGLTNDMASGAVAGAEALGELFGSGSSAGDAARTWSSKFRAEMVRKAMEDGEDIGEGYGSGIVNGMSNVMNEMEDFSALADATEDIQALIETLEESTKTFGMNADEITVWRAKQAGVSEELIKQAEALMKRRAEMEKTNDLMEEGKRLAEQMRTPHEKYADTIKRLKELLTGGAITQQTFARAMADAKEKLTNATETADAEVSVGGPSIGSIETALGDFNFAVGDKTLRVAEKSLAVEEKQVELLKDIKRDLGPTAGGLT